MLGLFQKSRSWFSCIICCFHLIVLIYIIYHYTAVRCLSCLPLLVLFWHVLMTDGCVSKTQSNMVSQFSVMCWHCLTGGIMVVSHVFVVWFWCLNMCDTYRNKVIIMFSKCVSQWFSEWTFLWFLLSLGPHVQGSVPSAWGGRGGGGDWNREGRPIVGICWFCWA